jgi:hypothetical protein
MDATTSHCLMALCSASVARASGWSAPSSALLGRLGAGEARAPICSRASLQNLYALELILSASLTRGRRRCGVQMFVTQRPQGMQLLVGLVRARRRRRALERLRGRTRLGGLLHLNAAWHSITLDRELAEGVDPQTSAVLELRARKLTRPRGRRLVADGLAGALRSATDTTPGITAAVRPDARELLEARIVLAVLERRLRGAEAVTAQGVAMLGVLLTDGASPLYRPSEPGQLASRLRAAAAALQPETTRPGCDATERQTAVLHPPSVNGITWRSDGPDVPKSQTSELPQNHE